MVFVLEEGGRGGAYVGVCFTNKMTKFDKSITRVLDELWSARYLNKASPISGCRLIKSVAASFTSWTWRLSDKHTMASWKTKGGRITKNGIEFYFILNAWVHLLEPESIDHVRNF
jgi:hypothetical protein